VSQLLCVSFANADDHTQGFAIDGVGALLLRGGELARSDAAAVTRQGEGWQLSAPGAGIELALLTAAAAGEHPPLWRAQARGEVGARGFDGVAIVSREAAPAAGELVRSLAITFDAQLALALHARRARGAGGHGDEELEAVVVRGDPAESMTVETPLLSSTYDGSGRLTHAGLELWEGEESEQPLRLGGEAIAHGELLHDQAGVTVVAFMDWHLGERHTPGTYAITTAD
jgi:hypothetical protein